MSRKIGWGTALSLMLLASAVTFTLTYQSSMNSLNQKLAQSGLEDSDLALISEAKSVIESDYIGPYDTADVVEGAILGMVSSLGDQWSYYYNAEDAQLLMADLQNKFVGIGVTVSYHEETGGIQIIEVYSGSPAEEAGIAPYDIVYSVNDELVTDIGYEMTVNNVRGDENTVVRLSLIRASDGAAYECAPIRRQMQVEGVRAEIIDDVGYIRIRNFDSGVDLQFKEAIGLLTSYSADLRGIVFDVRNNPGGQLEVMLPMLDQLLPEGPIFIARDKNGNEDVRSSDANEITMPMVVLVNDLSYSAAEFFAAALSEYDKATIVGEPTTGKGYSQRPISLKDGSILYLSVREYFTPKGVSLMGVGLTPDIRVTMSESDRLRLYTMSHDEDVQLQRALTEVRRIADERDAAQAAADAAAASASPSPAA